jgi:hypothetical protein
MKMLISGGAVIPPSTVQEIKKAKTQSSSNDTKQNVYVKTLSSDEKKTSKPNSNKPTDNISTSSLD